MVVVRVIDGTAASLQRFLVRVESFPQASPQAANMAVEMLKNEICANCGQVFSRPLEPGAGHARLLIAPSTERK
jgi:hypothetical protein